VIRELEIIKKPKNHIKTVVESSSPLIEDVLDYYTQRANEMQRFIQQKQQKSEQTRTIKKCYKSQMIINKARNSTVLLQKS